MAAALPQPVPEKYFRLRSKAYLKHVRSFPCLVCGQQAEAHHMTHAQPRGVALKTGDQFTVPLCHPHHMDLHQSPISESVWWALNGINPQEWAKENYERYSKSAGERGALEEDQSEDSG